MSGKGHKFPNLGTPDQASAPILVTKFLTSINGELSLIEDELATKKSERQSRSVPYHLRRRAVSHDIRRFPKRVRERIPKDSITPKTKRPSTKHRKKAKNKPAAYAERQTRVRWLESHVWHAKRFVMAPLWDWKVPLHPTDKCWKAARIAALKETFLIDLSYYSILEMKGSQAAILESFVGLTPPECNLAASLNCEMVLYRRNHYPRGAMGPVLFLWGPNTLWLVAHPQLEAELKEELPGAVALVPGEVGRHRLIGPKAKDILQLVSGWPATPQPGSLTSVTVTDPRLVAPSSRKGSTTKQAVNNSTESFWDPQSRNKGKKLSDHQVCQLRSNLCVPGEDVDFQVDPVPLLIYHHLDAQAFDVFFPRGWSQPFWIAYIYSGARAFGLRDFKRVSSRAFFPDHFPDTKAGREHHAKCIQALRDRYESLPSSKRLNYTFWGDGDRVFLHEWSKIAGGDQFYVLREQKILQQLQSHLEGTRSDVPQLEQALVVVRLSAVGRGSLEQYSTVHVSSRSRAAGLVLDGEYSITAGRVTGLAIVTAAALLAVNNRTVYIHPQHCQADIFYPFHATVELL